MRRVGGIRRRRCAAGGPQVGSAIQRQSSPPFAPTTMPSLPTLPNELWWKILADAISLESNLAMVGPSLERLYPFFPGAFCGFDDRYFYAVWKHSQMLAHNFVQVNRLWCSIAERFLYSAFYVEEEWRVQRFIDTIKLNPNLAKQLRTLVVTSYRGTRDGTVREVANFNVNPLILQILSLCHRIDAIVVDPTIASRRLHIFQSPNSSRCLVLLSALLLPVEEFATFMTNFNNYARLQILELSVGHISIHELPSHMLPSLPEHITFPSLHTLILRRLDPLIVNVVVNWELPSLKELSCTHASTALLPLI